MRISDWSSDVCSSDLPPQRHGLTEPRPERRIEALRTDQAVKPHDGNDGHLGAQQDAVEQQFAIFGAGRQQRVEYRRHALMPFAHALDQPIEIENTVEPPTAKVGAVKNNRKGWPEGSPGQIRTEERRVGKR